MKRGEVYWVNFEPSIGGEVKKRRPAVIVSNDFANKHLNRVQVIPFTSNTDKLYPSEIYVSIKGKDSKAKADQICTVSKTRLSKKSISNLTKDDMNRLEQVLKIQLGLIAIN